MTDHPTLFALITWIVPLIVAITFHEVAHGYTAYHFGDPTAHDAGRLSLDPLVHVDAFGTVILPMILILSGAPVFGWAKPVPVDPRRLRNPRWHGLLVTIAGPGINLVLAVFGAALLALTLALTHGRHGMIATFATANVGNFILINLFLCVFNLIPIPPLDGGRVVSALLPRRLAWRWDRIGRFGLGLMLLLLVVLPMVAPSANVIALAVNPPVHWLLVLLARVFGFA